MFLTTANIYFRAAWLARAQAGQATYERPWRLERDV